MNVSALVAALVPSVVVTVTFTVPADSAGDVAVIVPSELIVAFAADAPKWTDLVSVGTMYVPVMVTCVPPAVPPCDGRTDVTVGNGVP